MIRQQLAYDLYIRPAIDAAAERHKRPAFASSQAMRILVAVLLQESDMLEVTQRPTGPGRGFAQFEPGPKSGLAGLLKLPATAWVRTEIEAMGWPLDVGVLHWGCMIDQRLCAVLARALMWSDPSPLPADEDGAWVLYLRTWRPGKPRPSEWPRHWMQAGEIVEAGEQAEAVPEILASDWPGQWPRPARRWVMRRQRDKVDGHEYWTGEHVGPQRECNAVVSLDPGKAERWVSREAATAAANAYDPRMLDQGFEPHLLEEWSE